MSGITLLVLFAVFTLAGVWMLVDPVQYLLWLKDARPSLRLREDDPDTSGGKTGVSVDALAPILR